jgi:hypothetical protein
LQENLTAINIVVNNVHRHGDVSGLESELSTMAFDNDKIKQQLEWIFTGRKRYS